MTMHNAVLLTSQNKKLFAENQHQKWKWAQRWWYIAREDVLTDDEAQSLIEMSDNDNMTAVEETASRVQQWASSKCSVCLLLVHNAHTCSECQCIIW